MEERLKQLKDGLNGYFADEKKFTENQKVKIRSAIAKERKGGNRYVPAEWMKQGLSIAVACSLLLFVGTFAYINLSKERSQSKSISYDTASRDDAGVAQEQQAATDSNAKSAQAPKAKEYSESTKENFIVADQDDIPLEGVKTPVNEGILPLSEAMQKLYSQFEQNPDQELLRGLQPYQVMQLYYYAETQGDYETQYDLYIKDERYVVSTKEEYLEYIKKYPVSEENSKKQLENLKSVTSMTQVLPENKHKDYLDEAIIKYQSNKTGKYQYFTLLKNNEGIWTVSFMPIQ